MMCVTVHVGRSEDNSAVIFFPFMWALGIELAYREKIILSTYIIHKLKVILVMYFQNLTVLY